GESAGRYVARVHRADSRRVEARCPVHQDGPRARGNARALPRVSGSGKARGRLDCRGSIMIPMDAALGAIRGARKDTDVVITTMSAAKVWMDLGPLQPLDFVFVPSCMGHATSHALGIAIAQPDRRVIVCNGDGSMLMSLGSLVTVAAEAPTNLTLVIMDNGVYEVTGGQPVPHRPDFAALAKASGIPNVFRFDQGSDWESAAGKLLDAKGTTVIVLEIEPQPDRPAPKSPGSAAARAAAFRAALLAQ